MRLRVALAYRRVMVLPDSPTKSETKDAAQHRVIRLAIALARQAAREDHNAELNSAGEGPTCAAPSTLATAPTSKTLDR